MLRRAATAARRAAAQAASAAVGGSGSSSRDASKLNVVKATKEVVEAPAKKLRGMVSSLLPGAAPDSDAALPSESDQVAAMIAAFRTKAERDHRLAERQAHTKTLGVVRGVFRVGSDVPPDLAVGLFAKTAEYPCVLRFSSGSNTPHADHVPDVRGLGVRLLDPHDKQTPLGQDFVLSSTPTMPLGTVRDFFEAVHYVLDLNSPLAFAARMAATGRAGKLVQLQLARGTPDSLLVMPWYSATPFKLGESLQVKYKFAPALENAWATTHDRGATYLTDNLQRSLREKTTPPLSFNVCVQVRDASKGEAMSIEDASVEWDETMAPPRKVASIELEQPQTVGGEADADALDFNPANTIPEHAPLGALNHARAQIYEVMAEVRAKARAARSSKMPRQAGAPSPSPSERQAPPPHGSS